MIKNKELNDFLPDNKASYFKEFQNFSKEQINKDEIIKCIKTVLDPEIPVNIYDLGLIYNIDIKNNDVIINMTLTNPNCPVAGSMPKNVGKSVEKLNSLNSIKVNLVWEPKWHKDLMSEDAKLALDIF